MGSSMCAGVSDDSKRAAAWLPHALAARLRDPESPMTAPPVRSHMCLAVLTRFLFWLRHVRAHIHIHCAIHPVVNGINY
jgi:hypothetical protein